MNKFLRALSFAMVLALIIQMMPMSTVVEAVTVPEKEISSATSDHKILRERKDLRDKFTKVFEREDGSYTAVVSASPIHFEDNSKWQDIDNTLVESTVDGQAVLKNSDNAYSISLPKSLTGSGEAVMIEIGGYTISYAINDVSPSLLKNSVGAKHEMNKTDVAASDVQKAAKLEEKSAEVKYSAIQPDVDVEYVVLPDSVKESIILNKKPKGDKQFSFTIGAPGMTAKLLPDNSIEFYGTDGELVYNLPAPFMFDSNNVQSEDIKVSFTQNRDGTYALTYKPSVEWLQAKERTYPVVIDPVVNITVNESYETIYDTYVTSASGENHSHGSDTTATVGITNDGSYWAYFRPTTYLWASKAVVTSATLKVYAESETSQAMTIAAYTVTSNWFEQITYSNKPMHDALPIDYAVAPANEYGQITFDITKAFPRNQDSLNAATYPRGVMLGAYDSNVNSAVIRTSEYTNTSYTPIIEYSYIETTGLSDKYEYHTHSAGRAGTVSINDFTGGMYIERDELSIDGNIMPVSIKQYYSTATADLLNGCTSYYLSSCNNFEDYSRVWLTNYHRFVGFADDIFVDENGNSVDMYLYIDGTGRITYFVLYETVNNVEKWVEQYDKTSLPKGLTLSVPVSESGGDDFSNVTIEEPSEEKLAFDFAGRMVSMTAAEKEHVSTAPQIEISYKSINQYKFFEIDKIVDGSGREYRFTYNSFGQLTAIQVYDAQSNAITVGADNADLKMTYTYEGDAGTWRDIGKLVSATYPDGETVNYSYVSNHPGAPLIASVTDINGYRLAYTYDSKLAVTQIEESALNSSSTRVTGNVVDLSYDSSYQRTYEDSYGNVEVAQFDNYGRKIGIYNEEGQYKRTTYEDTEIDEINYNLLSGSSYVQEQKENLLLNSSFESGTSSWTVIEGASFSPGVDSTIKNTGSNSYKMNCTSNGTIGVNQSFTNLAAGTYSFSAYVKVPDEVTTSDGGAKISVETKNSVGTTVEHISCGYVRGTDSAWQRISVNIDVTPSTPIVNVYLWLYNSTGIAYFDNAKLELSDLETPYNVLLNSNMTGVTNDLPTNWAGSNLVPAVDLQTSQTKFDDTVHVMRITGSPTTQKSISQSFSISGGIGDVVDIGCWAKADAASNSNAEFRMRATYSYTNTNEQTVNVTETLDFIPYADYWQFVADSFTLLGTCSTITIYLDYDNQINTAFFTDVCVAYTDVETGGAESQGSNEPTYCACGEENCAYGLGCDCPCESEETCTCLQCHETTAHTYDSMGNITSTTVNNGTKEMVTSNSYTTDKNYLESFTNSASNVVQYGYNTGNGTLTSVTDSLNNTVGYTYNAMRVLAGASQNVSNLSSGTALTNSYDYTNDRLTGITAGNTVDYSFDYDLWGYQTEVRVGTQSLAEYTYGTGENCGRVASLTFGNGQTITYRYDSYNNVTGISYDGGTTYNYSYTYSSANGLTSVTDNISDQITYFTSTGYEVYTLPQSGQGVLLYSSSYDEDDNFVQSANGYTYTFADGAEETETEAIIRRTTGLAVKHSTISSNGTNLTLSSSTDFFGRQVNSTLGIKDGTNNLGSVAVEYTYQNSTGNRTTEYVSNYKNVVTPTTGSATNVEYTYTYDANGNIASDSLGGILKHSYVYDEAGQLVRVNDAEQNKTFCYTYDNGGNLVSKKRYAYTLDSLGSVLQTMGTYAYANSNWKDELTSYNNIPLTYDNIGNLICFDDISFTWSAGRQLEKFEISLRDYSVNYKYNADGLRTQKIIDDVENYMQITYDYIWVDGKLVSQTDGTDILYFLYDSNDSPIGFVLNDAATYLYIKNLQGDITGIADENGNIIVKYTYDEWGKLLSITGSEADIIGLLNPLRYRGYYYDTETGYYYLQSRYYNPKWGRFINADVIEYINGLSLFAYCGNNPVNFYDPTGEAIWFLIPVAVVGILALTGCSSSKYTPQYNTLYSDPSNRANFNCYAYALGRTDKCINPGYFSGKTYKLNIDTLKDNVLADLKSLGYKSKTVDKSYGPTIKETMIALRSGPSDYHFMKRMSDGSWTHKPGQTAILKLKGNPWDYTKWYGEYYNNKAWGIVKTIYYDSKIYYIVYWK